MKHISRLAMMIITLLAITTTTKAMNRMEEFRREQRARYERHKEQEENAQRLAAARANLETLIANPNIEDLHDTLVEAQSSTDPEVIDSIISLAKTTLSQKQQDVVAPLILAADQALARAEVNTSGATLEALLRAIQDLDHGMSQLTDQRNPLEGELKERAEAKLHSLQARHEALMQELTQGLRRAPARTAPAPRVIARPTATPINITQLNGIQLRIQEAEHGTLPGNEQALKHELTMLQKELVRFISGCYREEKHILLQQAQGLKEGLDERIERLDRTIAQQEVQARRSSEDADEALARQLQEEENQGGH